VSPPDLPQNPLEGRVVLAVAEDLEYEAIGERVTRICHQVEPQTGHSAMARGLLFT
jgi:hypothetical protein